MSFNHLRELKTKKKDISLIGVKADIIDHILTASGTAVDVSAVKIDSTTIAILYGDGDNPSDESELVIVDISKKYSPAILNDPSDSTPVDRLVGSLSSGAGYGHSLILIDSDTLACTYRDNGNPSSKNELVLIDITDRTSPSIIDIGPFDIDVVNVSTETFTIAGDQTSIFVPNMTFKVSGSTANDGIWAVSSSVYSNPNTIITVTGDIVNSTADGEITNSRLEGYLSSGAVDLVQKSLVKVDSTTLALLYADGGNAVANRNEFVVIDITNKGAPVLLNDPLNTVPASRLDGSLSSGIGSNNNLVVIDSTTIAAFYKDSGNTVSGSCELVLIDITTKSSPSILNNSTRLDGSLSSGSSSNLSMTLLHSTALVLLYTDSGNPSGENEIVAVDISTLSSPSIFDYSHPILSSSALKRFSIFGDYTSRFIADFEFIVSGSASNDGKYSVVSSSYGALNTTIIVNESVVTGGASGNIINSRLVGGLSSGNGAFNSIVTISSTIVACIYQDTGNPNDENEIAFVRFVTGIPRIPISNDSIRLDSDLSSGAGTNNSLIYIDSDTLVNVFVDSDANSTVRIAIIDSSPISAPEVINGENYESSLDANLYYYKIIGIDANRNVLGISEPIKAIVPEDNLKIVDLTWNQISGVTEYEIYRGINNPEEINILAGLGFTYLENNNFLDYGLLTDIDIFTNVLNYDNKLLSSLSDSTSTEYSLVVINENIVVCFYNDAANTVGKAELKIIDISDKSAPIVLNPTYDLSDSFVTTGNYTYYPSLVKIDDSTVAVMYQDGGDGSTRNKFKIIDISNYVKPTIVNTGTDLLGSLSSGSGDHISMVLVNENTLAAVYKDAGNTNQRNEISIIDISNRVTPSVLNLTKRLDDGSLSGSIGIYNSLVYIDENTVAVTYADSAASYQNELAIIDISNTNSPSILNGSTKLGTSLSSGQGYTTSMTKLDNKTLALVYRDGGNPSDQSELVIVDISDLTTPSILNSSNRLVGELGTGYGTYHSMILISEDLLCIVLQDQGNASNENELIVIRTSDRTTPEVLNDSNRLVGLMSVTNANSNIIARIDNNTLVAMYRTTALKNELAIISIVDPNIFSSKIKDDSIEFDKNILIRKNLNLEGYIDSDLDLNKNRLLNLLEPTDDSHVPDRGYNDKRYYKHLFYEGIIKDPNMENASYWDLDETASIDPTAGHNSKSALRMKADSSHNSAYYNDPIYGKFIPITSQESLHFIMRIRTSGTPTGAGTFFVLRILTYEKDKTTSITAYEYRILGTELSSDFKYYYGASGPKLTLRDNSGYIKIHLWQYSTMTGGNIDIDMFQASINGFFPTYPQIYNSDSVYLPTKPYLTPHISGSEDGPVGASNIIWLDSPDAHTVTTAQSNDQIVDSAAFPFQVKAIKIRFSYNSSERLSIYKGSSGTTAIIGLSVFSGSDSAVSGTVYNALTVPISYFSADGTAYMRWDCVGGTSVVANIIALIL